MATLKAQVIDILNKKITPAEITFNSHIESIIPVDETVTGFALPGFIDAHVHIESSMLVPSEFARLAVVHGTVATVSDPHEIANVLGMEGVRYMVDNGAKVNFKFNFGAPSCVPATAFETAGATITADDIDQLLGRKDIRYLAEMMNWPGVIHHDPEVLNKIAIAKKHKKPVDGHAPGLMGQEAIEYIKAGISTDHECITLEEALHKIAHGMKISIREGSAAKNFEALFPIIDRFPELVMLCSDDKHPDYLVKSHIDELVRRALAKGISLFNVLRAACINPIDHYGLEVGQLRVGDPADFIIINNLEEIKVQKNFINGQLVASHGQSHIARVDSDIINICKAVPITPEMLQVKILGEQVRVIQVADGQLTTSELLADSALIQNEHQCSVKHDILKLVVLNRYEKNQPPAIAYIQNFGFQNGAIASTVAHDSHNIIATGTSDKAIADAINAVIKTGGGVSATDGVSSHLLPLSVAGLMSTEDGYKVAKDYELIEQFVREKIGTKLTSPFMSLSFMALLVIPSLKLSDKGLFDGLNFKFCNVFEKLG